MRKPKTTKPHKTEEQQYTYQRSLDIHLDAIIGLQRQDIRVDDDRKSRATYGDKRNCVFALGGRHVHPASDVTFDGDGLIFLYKHVKELDGRDLVCTYVPDPYTIDITQKWDEGEDIPNGDYTFVLVKKEERGDTNARREANAKRERDKRENKKMEPPTPATTKMKIAAKKVDGEKKTNGVGKDNGSKTLPASGTTRRTTSVIHRQALPRNPKPLTRWQLFNNMKRRG